MIRSALRQRLCDLGWGLWSQLGVSEWSDQHRCWFVDPEPLILFTAWLGDSDARLRDEATDWCVQFGSLASGTRLTNLLEGASRDTRSGFGEFAATVREHSAVRWRGARTPRSFVPTGRSRLESTAAPSRLSLRLRTIFGVSARAELIRLLICSDPIPQVASDLVAGSGFKKRNVAEALHTLHLGGVLTATRVRNQLRYRLRDPAAWGPLLGELPVVWPRWTLILPLMATVTDQLESIESASDRVRRVEMNKLSRTVADSVGAAGLPPPEVGDASSGDGDVCEWALRVSTGLAAASSAIVV